MAEELNQVFKMKVGRIKVFLICCNVFFLQNFCIASDLIKVKYILEPWSYKVYNYTHALSHTPSI